MKQTNPKFTAADRKALALAAFLFYLDREYQVELNHYSNSTRLQLTVFYENTRTLENCPLLNWPFIQCTIEALGPSDKYAQWTIPL